jgi:tetratricopeptide (TPR) repeat protein
MKAFSRITLLFVSILLLSVTGLMAQRTIHGTVYMDGKPAPGVSVEAHRGAATTLTDFDGNYQVDADAKSKWIEFTAVDGTKKRIDLDENTGDKIDCALTGEIPTGDEEDNSSEVILKTHEELVREQNKDYMNSYSLYNTDKDEKKMESALTHWKEIYNKYPASSKNVYIHGAQIYESLIENAKTDEEKDKLLDELMKMYDKRIKYFKESGYVLGRKATSLLEYKITSRNNPVEGQELTDVLKKAYEWLNTSISEQGVNAELPTLVLFMNTTISLYRLGELPKETVVKNYDSTNKVLDNIISENKDPERVKSAKEVVKPYIEEKFGESGAADCEAMVNIYTPQFEQNSEDAEFIKTMLKKLRRVCDDNELLEKATVKLYQLDPSAEAAFNMAHSYFVKDDIANAKKYYLQAIEQETDKTLLATYYYEYAAVLYGKDRNFQEAREMVKKAISADPTFCKAYMLLGDIYVAASSTFSNDNFEKGTVYWVAVDYYNKARTYDDCSVDAAKKASEYRKGFPNKEEGFMREIQEGKPYKVEGWINETTTARF